MKPGVPHLISRFFDGWEDAQGRGATLDTQVGRGYVHPRNWETLLADKGPGVLTDPITDSLHDTLGDHIVLTEAHGELRGQTLDGVRQIADAAAASRRVVLHFHGGLVSEERGRAIAADLLPVYRDAGAYPVFFVWRSGLLEILRGHLKEIADEDAFKALTKLVIKFVVGKVLGSTGAKGGFQLPDDHNVATEFALHAVGVEPYANLAVPETLDDLTAADEASVEQRLRADPQLRAIGRAIAESALSPEQREGARSATRLERAAETTLMSPEIVDELQESAPDTGDKGIVTAAVLAKHAARAVRNVIHRYRVGRDHGVYCTAIEEILREFYAANAGGRIWATMKQETADTFVEAAPARGGITFMRSLGDSLRGGARPEITLVGHSTGAVFINNLLGQVVRMRSDPSESLPDDFRFHAIAFLAPACTFTDFALVLQHREHLWRRFRMFTMTDDAERHDSLVPIVYPRSLLYFVSGLLETGPDGKGDAGKPLVGLARCFDREREDDAPEVHAVRSWIQSEAGQVVWSPVNGGLGLSSGAVSHGDFDDDEKVRESLGVLIGGAS